jgi:hypothetical protein
MFAFPVGFKIYLAVEPVDMRKQFNGLWAMAGEKLRRRIRAPARSSSSATRTGTG